MKVTVDRTKWCRGDIGGDSLLLNEHGNMCCLGFACIQLYGKSTNEINRHLMPRGVSSSKNMPLFVYGDFSSKFAIFASDINDDRHIKEKEREKKLISLFKENNVQLEFIN